MFQKIEDFNNKINNYIAKNLKYFFENKSAEKLLFFLIIILIVIGMYTLNHYTTLIVDDYVYSFSRVTGNRITNITEILQSEYNHYFTWGGRIIVHTIAQFFLMIDKAVFDIANTFAYLAMVLVVYFHAVGKIKFYPFLLLLINLLFFLCMPVFGQVFLWVVGACNYLWGPLIVLLYLMPYRLQYNRENPVITNKILCAIFGFVGVIAGWTNENLGLTLIFLILIFSYLYWYQHQKIYLWCICGLIGVLIGAAALILAPGNFVRMEISEKEVNIMSNIFNITRMFFKSNYLLLPDCILLIFIVISKKKVDYKLLSVYIIGFLISMYAMIGSPVYANRAKIGSLLFVVIACCYLYTNLDFSNIKIRKIIAILTIAMISILFSEYKLAVYDIKDYKFRNDAKVEYILKEKAKGNMDIVVDPNYPKTRYAAPYGLEDLPTDGKTTSFAKYYGVRSVRVEEDKYRLAKELRQD